MAEEGAVRSATHGPMVWGYPLGFSAAMILLAGLGGGAGLAAALIVLPVAVSLLEAQGGWKMALPSAVIAAGLCVWRLTGPWEMAGIAWCACVAGCGLVRIRQPMARVFLWGGAALAGACGVVALLLHETGGHLVTGTAAMLVDLVDHAANRDELLIRAYQLGFAGLEGKLAILPAVRIGDVVVMSAEVRLQLLYGLRTTVEDTLQALLPQVMVWWPTLTALLCAVLPDWWLRRRGLSTRRLPAFELWHMPRGTGIRVAGLGLGWLVAAMTDSAVMAYFGGMCASAFSIAYMVQGAATMWCMQKRAGVRPVSRGIGLAVILLIFPPVLVILGVVDQATDPRKIRETKDKEDI